ncbi:urease accessory protein UreF [Gorillibacterium sp. sgz500922]|uniref:urease accessory protein UreF n=1 Tax=Gorillibacterium sp. sgz500922 TaxID=3446694 RepID=UPI003F66C473
MNAKAGYTRFAYLQLLDSALPVGGFSHSFGLEAQVQSGRIRTIEELEEYLQTLLVHGWAAADALVIKAAYEAQNSGDLRSVPSGEAAAESSLERLWRADRLLYVQRAAEESREALRKMGSRLLRLGERLYPEIAWEPLAAAIREKRCIGTYPAVHGWFACSLGVGLDEAACGYLYASAAQAVGSALRLMPIGQTQAQLVLKALMARLEPSWFAVCGRDPLDLGASVPAADIGAMQHASLHSRLFMS